VASLRRTGSLRVPRASSVKNCASCRARQRCALCASAYSTCCLNRHTPAAFNPSCGAAEFRQCAFLDLTDAFGADAESRADFGELLGWRVEAEARLHDLPLALG